MVQRLVSRRAERVLRDEKHRPRLTETSDENDPHLRAHPFDAGPGERRVRTAPGASHGPTTVNPSGPGRSGSDAGAAAGMGQAAHGGSGNGTSASGMGTTQGSGGMQPRLDKNGNGGNSERRSTGTNGGAQGL
jgi:hypothetical protein